MWRGGKANSRSVPALPETERLKMGALIPYYSTISSKVTIANNFLLLSLYGGSTTVSPTFSYYFRLFSNNNFNTKEIKASTERQMVEIPIQFCTVSKSSDHVPKPSNRMTYSAYMNHAIDTAHKSQTI